jgi:hypothetical protein
MDHRIIVGAAAVGMLVTGVVMVVEVGPLWAIAVAPCLAASGVWFWALLRMRIVLTADSMVVVSYFSSTRILKSEILDVEFDRTGGLWGMTPYVITPDRRIPMHAFDYSGRGRLTAFSEAAHDAAFQIHQWRKT